MPEMKKVISALCKLFLKLILGLSVCGIGFSFWILWEGSNYLPLLISIAAFISSALLLYIPFRKECIKEKEEFEKSEFR
jgi:hypothetical protein